MRVTAKQAGPPDLEVLVGPAADTLVPGGVLSASDLPAMPATSTCESIMVTKSVMGYSDSGGFGSGLDRDEGGYYRADVLNFCASQRGYCVLATAMASVLLHRGEASTEILFTSPQSQVKALILQKGHADYADLGLVVAPVSFTPTLDRGAALEALVSLDDLRKPRFLLTHRDDLTDVQKPWDARDHVRLAASEIGLLLFTSALIDYALHGTPDRELACRAPPLTGGDVLGMCSAEARFWLPGSIGWPVDDPAESD